MYFLTKSGVEHKKCLKILHEFTKSVIDEREDEIKSENFVQGKRKAFLDILLNAKLNDATLTSDDIQEEVDTFMFEGHDTVTSAISWTVQLIGSHPHVQKKLHKEIDKVFGSSDRYLTNEDIHLLDYLECVIKESLRLFPSVPFLGRKVSEDCEIAGFKIPKGD